MTPEERETRVKALFEAAINPTKEQIEYRLQELNTEIEDYEQISGISSKRLVDKDLDARIVAGRYSFYGSWLMALKCKEGFEKILRENRE